MLWAWASSAGFLLLGCFEIWQWLSCRRSPTRRESTARNYLLGPVLAPSTVAGRRALLDAQLVAGVGLTVLALSGPVLVGDGDGPLHRAALWLSIAGLLLFAVGWPLCAVLARPRWLRPPFARDEAQPIAAARRESRCTPDEAWRESGGRVAAQERWLRERRTTAVRE
jgi:hypothetical protein